MERDIFEVRQENIRRLVLDRYDGNRAAFSRSAGVHQNQINLILTDNKEHRRNLGEGLARKIEDQLGLPTGRLDQPHIDSQVAGSLVSWMPVGEVLRNALKPSTFLLNATISSSWLASFDSRITAIERVGIAEVATDDMLPDLHTGDTVLIDAGANAASVDGIYLLAHGVDGFLRRVRKQLDGTLMISADPTHHQPMIVDNMKRFKVLGRVLLAISARRV